MDRRDVGKGILEICKDHVLITMQESPECGVKGVGLNTTKINERVGFPDEGKFKTVLTDYCLLELEKDRGVKGEKVGREKLWRLCLKKPT